MTFLRGQERIYTLRNVPLLTDKFCCVRRRRRRMN
jgi:hypothetical protein